MHHNHKTWIDAFRHAFDGMAADLAVVLNAKGCREGWIQAELFRRLSQSDPDFSVNSYKLSKGKTADLHGQKPNPMLAEVKVLGTEGYYNKNLAGCSNLALFLPANEKDRVDLCDEHLAVVDDAVDSLLRDFGRLKSAPANFERYLILVLQTSGVADTFGKAISAIRVTANETTLSYPEVLVRIWRIE